MKLRGTVRFHDLEGGVWILEAEDGRTFQLAGGDRKLKQDGRGVEVEGESTPETVSAGMVGPVLNVRSYRLL